MKRTPNPEAAFRRLRVLIFELGQSSGKSHRLSLRFGHPKRSSNIETTHVGTFLWKALNIARSNPLQGSRWRMDRFLLRLIFRTPLVPLTSVREIFAQRPYFICMTRSYLCFRVAHCVISSSACTGCRAPYICNHHVHWS